MQKYKPNSIDKLIDIASSSIGSEMVNLGEIHDSSIYNLLTARNGFYAFENALHVFSDKEFNRINKTIKIEKLYSAINCLYFAEDIFGNLFCKKNNKIYILDVETGDLDLVADTLAEWASKILEDYNYLAGYSLAHNWQVVNGRLHEDQRLSPRKLFIFGGLYSIDNLVAQDTIEALRYRSSVAHQLKNVKDGEKVIVERKTYS